MNKENRKNVFSILIISLLLSLNSCSWNDGPDEIVLPKREIPDNYVTFDTISIVHTLNCTDIKNIPYDDDTLSLNIDKYTCADSCIYIAMNSLIYIENKQDSFDIVEYEFIETNHDPLIVLTRTHENCVFWCADTIKFKRLDVQMQKVQMRRNKMQ